MPGEAIPDPILPQPRANAYIVAPDGPSISIPVDQANEAHAHIINVDEIKAGESLTAELIWTDVKGAVSGKGLAPDAAIAHFYVAGTGPEARLVVKPGSQPGNAVIAVKSRTGTIRWSWHIWVTDYDPETETGQKSINGYVFMDRNLGAMSAEPALNNANGVIGNYYQWGRKDPFPSKSRGTAALTFTPVYDQYGWDKTWKSVSKTTMPQTIVEPFVVSSTNGTYLPKPETADPTKVWNKDGEKTAFDPCPPGWRVPVKDAYADLDLSLLPVINSGGANAGFYQEQCGFFPFTWNLNYAAIAAPHNNPAWNFTWTADAASNTLAYAFQNRPAAVGVSTNSTSFGFTVRCVRDWARGKLANEVRVLSVANTLSSGHPLDVAERTQTAFGIVPMTTVNFGPGKKVNAVFKYYSLGTLTDLIPQLEEHDIDVLYLAQGTAPTVDQAAEIKQWVDAGNNRVLIYTLEQAGTQTLTRAYCGFGHVLEAARPHTLVNDPQNADNQAIVVGGPFGAVAKTAFTNANSSGAISKTDAEAKGLVPLLLCANATNYYSLLYHPDWRVVFLGDQGFFRKDLSPGPLNANGSLTATTKGDYPLLMANLWAWIANTALKGR